MGTDKDINHTWDSEDWDMESATQMRESIDIVPLLDRIDMPIEDWYAFLRKCKEKGVDCHEHLTKMLYNNIQRTIHFENTVSLSVRIPATFWHKHVQRCHEMGVDPNDQASLDVAELYKQL